MPQPKLRPPGAADNLEESVSRVTSSRNTHAQERTPERLRAGPFPHLRPAHRSHRRRYACQRRFPLLKRTTTTKILRVLATNLQPHRLTCHQFVSVWRSLNKEGFHPGERQIKLAHICRRVASTGHFHQFGHTQAPPRPSSQRRLSLLDETPTADFHSQLRHSDGRLACRKDSVRPPSVLRVAGPMPHRMMLVGGGGQTRDLKRTMQLLPCFPRLSAPVIAMIQRAVFKKAAATTSSAPTPSRPNRPTFLY